MKAIFRRVDAFIDKAANVLFIVIASLIALLIAGLLLRMGLESILKPLYACLQPRMGFFFVLFVLFILFVLLMPGEIIGSGLAHIPFVIHSIREGRMFVLGFKYLKFIATFIGLYGVAKVLLMALKQQEEGLEVAVIAKLVWNFFAVF